MNTPTCNIGSLPIGTATATWKITGVSQGSDILLISASATNTHENLRFSDSDSPSYSIFVTRLTLTQALHPLLLQHQLNHPHRPLTPPLPTHLPKLKQQLPSQLTLKHLHQRRTFNLQYHQLIQQSSNTPFSTPQPGQNSPTPPPNPTASPDPLNSPMLYIHPPIAIIGFFFTFFFRNTCIQE